MPPASTLKSPFPPSNIPSPSSRSFRVFYLIEAFTGLPSLLIFMQAVTPDGKLLVPLIQQTAIHAERLNIVYVSRRISHHRDIKKRQRTHFRPHRSISYTPYSLASNSTMRALPRLPSVIVQQPTLITTPPRGVPHPVSLSSLVFPPSQAAISS